MPQVILAIDQGTTGTTVFVVDARGRIRGRAYGEIRQFYPKPGWVEHDPRGNLSLGRRALEESDLARRGCRARRSRESASPISARRSWYGSGAAAARSIARSYGNAAAAPRFATLCAIASHEVAQRTGLLVDPYFSGTKLKWLLDEKPELRERGARGELCFGTIDTWLIYKLSRGADS